MIAKSARMRWSTNPKNEKSVKTNLSQLSYFCKVNLGALSTGLQVSSEAKFNESESTSLEVEVLVCIVIVFVWYLSRDC